MNNNHKNSGCGKASELVSYLYGETGEAENPEFEKHLASCSICADELAAFSGVKFSINDWKLKDFDSLQTPVIEIPYPTAPNKQEVSSLEVSWLAGLRKLFSFSPSWSLATAAMAILVVCIGIILFASNSPNSNDRAGTVKNSMSQVSPTVEKSPERSNANSTQNKLPDTESQPFNKPQAPQPELTVQPDNKNKRPVKTANTPNRTQKAETTNLPKNEDVKRDNKKKNEIPPKIFDEEEEDDTLRLAEMLEEIDTVE